MKKFMYLIPLAAVALASCSNESTDSREQRTATNPGTALNIFPAVQGSTRGQITNDANFKEFKVQAAANANFWYVDQGATAPDPSNASSYSVLGTGFTATVKKSATTNKWEIEAEGVTGVKDYYWSSKSMTSSFTAWAPTSFDPEADFIVENKIEDQKDVVYAYNSGAASNFTSGVPMNFQHALSQVVIKALNKDNTYEIKVAGVKLNNIVNSGKFNLDKVETATTSGVFSWPTDVWTLRSSIYTYVANESKATASTFTTTPITLSSAAKQLTSEPFILMPQTKAKADLTQPAASITGAYFSILVQVKEKANDKMKYPTLNGDADATPYYAYVAVPVDIDWKPGYKYTYTLNFSKDGIGKVDPNQPDDDPGNGYPSGTPGEDIVDGPVQLYFTVTVEDWTDAFETIGM